MHVNVKWAYLLGHLLGDQVLNYRIYSERNPTLCGGLLPVEVLSWRAESFSQAHDDIVAYIFSSGHLRHLRPWFYPGRVGFTMRMVMQYRAAGEQVPEYLWHSAAVQECGESDEDFLEHLLLTADPTLAELEAYNPYRKGAQRRPE